MKDKAESKTLRDATWTIVSGIVTAIVALGAYVWELVEGEATFSASAFSGLVTGAIVAGILALDSDDEGTVKTYSSEVLW